MATKSFVNIRYNTAKKLVVHHSGLFKWDVSHICELDFD